MARGMVRALLVLSQLSAVAGHSYLDQPAARNVVAGDTCKHCLQAGGPDTVSTRGSGIWPTRLAPGSHGLCGDPVQNRAVTDFKSEPYMVAGAVQATYSAGDIVTFRIGVSTHHMGHYEFRICNKPLDASTLADAAEGQACLDQWVLHRAPPAASCQPNGPADCQPLDPDHPERWYLPPPNHDTQVAGSDWSDDDYSSVSTAGEYHTMRYVIPAGLSCEKCTLQWYWSTGNTCLYDEGYITYFKNMQSLGWNAAAWAPQAVASWATKKSVTCGPEGKGVFGEEFWNCADIEVLPGGPTPAPTPAPPTPPTAAPVTTTATTSAGPCAALWAQCGGQSHTGYTCCQSGSYCKYTNDWYSQCVEGSGPTVAPTPAPPAPPTAMPTAMPTPMPGSPTAAPTPPPASTTPVPSPGQCTCSKSTSWDGSFAQFADGSSFCSQNFGSSTPYISAGGGAGSSGGWSGSEPCSSGQYSFSQDGQWSITMSAAQAQGKVPYRAFAYAQFCNGRPYSECWAGQGSVSFSFRFMVENMEQIGAYAKLLFWTDSGNILGLLPANHPKGSGQLRLVTFMTDDYPNSWLHEAPVQLGAWQRVQVDFSPASQAVNISLNGAALSQGSLPVNMLAASSGPQLGLYSFDFGGGVWPSEAVKLSLRDPCIGTLSCSAEPEPEPESAEPEPEPESPEPEPESPEPEPEPEVEPAPSPAPGCAALCSLTDVSEQTCKASGSSPETCSQGYIVKGNLAAPCAWSGCSCFADGEQLLECPDLASTCAALLQEQAQPKLRLQSKRLRGQMTLGAAFIQGQNVSLQRAELGMLQLREELASQEL